MGEVLQIPALSASESFPNTYSQPGHVRMHAFLLLMRIPGGHQCPFWGAGRHCIGIQRNCELASPRVRQLADTL